MTKIRSVSLLLCFVLLLMSFVGCGDEYNGEYVALQVGVSYGVDSGKHAREVEFWNRSEEGEDAPKSATVTFNGRTYSGDYDDSSLRLPDLYVSHYYKSGNVQFSIDGKEGELVSISFAYDFARGGRTQEECRPIADAIADDYISLSEYKFDVTVVEHPLQYTFTYYREISGYQTADRLSISIDGTGRIRSFRKGAIGSFEDIESVPIDEKKAEEAISAKLDAIYEEDTLYREYEVKSVVLIKLEDDTCALFYTVNIPLVNGIYHSDSGVYILLKVFHKGE